MLSFLERNLDPRNWWDEAAGQKKDEVLEGAREDFVREGDVGGLNGGSSGETVEMEKVRGENGASGGEMELSEQDDDDWVKVPSMLPDGLGMFAQGHPMDPHEPNFSELLPEGLRPYPAFEGWFIRIWDSTKEFSAAVIMATNYATDESQVTILFAPGRDVNPEGDREAVKCGFTYAVAVKTKDAKFTRNRNAQECGERNVEPEGFRWEANGIGSIVVTPYVTEFDFTVEGYHFKAHLTKEMLWDSHNSEIGPEGWARYVSIIPCHWYVYSLGSTVDYSFSNPEKKIYSEGSAIGHVEKNWGLSFPAGHVWLQAFSSDNTSQVCCAGAYFNTSIEKLSSPYIFVLGYRSPKLQLDFRTNDMGIVFKNINFSPLESCFSITAVGPSHTIELKAYAPYDTFSDPVLAPVTKREWKPACRESYLATVEMKVYEHLAWGIPGTENLVETQVLKSAALEFGEDLLTEAS
ncbi:hypothetical protein M758_7G085500 [Ceratodon purpureus]|nr:hypothetical protein M758_7G085500 [Ceratodon purpureus]